MSEGGFPKPIMTATTEAFLPGSDIPVQVKPRQLNEDVVRLTREDFRKASEVQKQKDAEHEAALELARRGPINAKSQAKQRAEQIKVGPEVVSVSPPKPKQVAGARPSGKRSQAPQRTSRPTPTPKADSRIDGLETRLTALESNIESGFSKILDLVARQHAGGQSATEALAQLEPAPEDVFDADESEYGEGFDLGAEDEDDLEAREEERGSSPLGEKGDPFITRMQAFIQRRNALKEFRRFWAGVSARAAFQEWPSEMQERFTSTFHHIILHPKFLHQVRKTTNTFRNGQVIGEEQMYRTILMLAGCVALYNIISDPSAEA